jgi:sulfide:quinone oxidoreductase
MTKRRVPVNVLVVGGGVAALEVVLALRDLAGDRVAMTIVTPATEFVERPMTVAEPFGLGRARRYRLDRIAAEQDAELVHAAVHAVRADQKRVVLRSGDTLPYDVLVLAPGARTIPAFEDTITFGLDGSTDAMRALLVALEQGVARRVAFVAPTSAGWLLPLYELALMTARLAPDAKLWLITPEDRPLSAFGETASEEITTLLNAFGVEFIASTHADVQAGEVMLGRATPALMVDRVVALPLVRGPNLDGVPVERDYGFIPVDGHGRVAGLDDVYAAGDATDFPIKQGGIACQQADVVAEQIAAFAGAPVTPSPFQPVMRGMLFTGGDERYLQTPLPSGPAQASPQPLWWPRTKIAGRYLAPYLLDPQEREASEHPPAGFANVEIVLDEPAVSRPPQVLP